jgi:COMPASS component SWD3
MTLGDSESEVFCLKYNPDDQFLAAGFGDGAIRIYNPQTTKCAYTLCSKLDLFGQSDDMPVTSLRWRPISANLKTTNVLVTSTADGFLKHWHVTSGRCLYQTRIEFEGANA